jgi:hypothetical protein
MSSSATKNGFVRLARVAVTGVLQLRVCIIWAYLMPTTRQVAVIMLTCEKHLLTYIVDCAVTAAKGGKVEATGNAA